VEASPDYQKLKQDYDTASKNAAPRIKEINERLRDLGAQILAVQNVFTDRRAYVSASTYDIETETSSSAKERKRRNLEEYKKESTTAEMPDGKKKTFKDYDELEKTYNDLKNERTQLSAELGEIIKPGNEKKELMDAYLTDHMVNLTHSQLTGLQNKTEAWTPKIVQINVNEHNADIVREDSSNIVDRCESCHMGIREPVKLTAVSMSLKGKKPDEYARAFTSHPEPELLKIHDPYKFGSPPSHQGHGRATPTIDTHQDKYQHG